MENLSICDRFHGFLYRKMLHLKCKRKGEQVTMQMWTTEQLNIYMITFMVMDFYAGKCFILYSRVKVYNKTIDEDFSKWAIFIVIFFFLSLYYVSELTGVLLLFVPMFKVPPFLLHDRSYIRRTSIIQSY